MRRGLFDTIKVIPAIFTAGSLTDEVTGYGIVDRQDFLSGVLALDFGSITGDPDEALISATLLTGDAEDGSDMEILDDELAILPKPSFAVDQNYDLRIDLLGCKRYITLKLKPIFTGGTDPAIELKGAALVLGDKNANPA